MTLAFVLSDAIRDSALLSHNILLSIWTCVPLGTGCSSITSALKQEDTARLPWWPSGEESSCQCRGHRLDPWSRKIPCAAGQRSPRSAARKTTPRRALSSTAKSSPHSPQLEKVCTATKTQHYQEKMLVRGLQIFGSVCILVFLLKPLPHAASPDQFIS